jgi:hypothetical protein
MQSHQLSPTVMLLLHLQSVQQARSTLMPLSLQSRKVDQPLSQKVMLIPSLRAMHTLSLRDTPVPSPSQRQAPRVKVIPRAKVS